MAVESVYYARSRDVMGSVDDRENMSRLRRMFPRATIRIVSRQECRVDARKAKSMEPFFDIVDAVDVVVIDERNPGLVSAGVFSEAQHALHQGKPVYSLRADGTYRVESVHTVKNAGKNQSQAGDWARVFSRKL